MTGPALREFASQLARLERKVAGLGSPQLGDSSFDEGGITQYSRDGKQVVSRFGEQYDGAGGFLHLSGPTPPQCSPPTVRPGIGGFHVDYRGGFVSSDGAIVVPPSDLSHFNIYVDLDPDFEIDRDNLRASLLAAGGDPLIGATPENEWYVRVAAVSKAGKVGPASVAVGPVRAKKIDVEDLTFDPADYSGNTIHYGPEASPPETDKIGDLWLVELGVDPDTGVMQSETRRWDGDEWEPLRDQGITDSLAAAIAAQQAAAAKATVLTQPDEPIGLGADDKVVWFDSDDGNRGRSWNGSGWDDLRLGTGAIQPNSLIAEDVIATGTVTAALLEALLILASEIIAGDPNGTHVRLKPTGLYVYRHDPIDGIPDEVIRMGTATNDYFGITDDLGMLVGSWDSTGALNARTANFREDITVEGASLGARLATTGRGQVGKWSAFITGLDGTYGIRSEYGICQFTFPVEAGRSYMIRFDGPAWFTWSSYPTAEVRLRCRTNLGAPVTLTSPVLRTWPTTGWPDNKYNIPNHAVIYDATTTGVLHFGVTLQLAHWPDPVNSSIQVTSTEKMFMEAYDMGPTLPGTAGQQTSMGGQLHNGPAPTPPPPAVQQYNTGWLAPAGWRTFRGNGTERFDVPGPVQGWDPSGFNGDGSGFWWWNLPSITGTVDEVWVWLQSDHWLYDTGGTARLAPIRNGAAHPVTNYMVASPIDVPGFPKPGNKQVNISTWKNLFHNNQGGNRAIGVSVGPIGNTNGVYYGRFDGPSARLLLKFTQ